jgi:hypothetical protein
MNDFGEALPFGGKIHAGDPAGWHNRFPEEWARVAREAIEESGHGDEIVFFDRSGFTQSHGAATLFWMGDQMESWDAYGGIKTAVVGLLSGGRVRLQPPAQRHWRLRQHPVQGCRRPGPGNCANARTAHALD